MLNEATLSHGVMEGKGAYNKHAIIPATGGTVAAPFLERAARKITLDPEDQPVLIADYGSSQGKNSLVPMQLAIRTLQPRIRPNRPIFVFHIDQPSNDFNSLFEVLSSDPGRNALGQANVFPCAIGKSFYEQVLPPGSVHLGWCSYAAVWLSRIPSLIPGHFFPACSTGATRDAFARQSAEDWETFLSLRSCEMRLGARLVVVLPALPDHGVSGFVELMNHANAVLTEMLNEGAIAAQERERMVVGVWARRKEDLLAPFARDGQFQQLIVEDCDISELPDVAWTQYELDGDKEALARKKALFFRAVFMPTLASALTQVRAGDSNAISKFADRLQDGLIQRLTGHPAPDEMFVETIVLAKTG